MQHVYYLTNPNASDNPDAADFACITVRMFDADYRAATGTGRVIVQNGITRDTAALYFQRARERGWLIRRWSEHDDA